MTMTVKGIKKLDDMPIPDRYDLKVSEMRAIKDYGDSFGYRSSVYYVMISAFKLGFKRGKSYQKKQDQK